MYVYVYLNLASIPKPLPIIQRQPSNQTTYCLAQPLAQARQSRLSESPFRLGEGSKQEQKTTWDLA